MDPTVLEDIRIVEKWHRKLMTAGVCSDVYRRYAECMRRGLASWEQQQSVVYTEDVNAAENYRDNGTWSSCLNRYMWFVMGGQGAGLFFDDGGPSPDYINFWLNVDDELRQAVEREAYLVATMCTAHHGVGPEDLGCNKGMYALIMLDEVFAEASSNARELVEKWAAQEYDKQEELLDEKASLGSVRAELPPAAKGSSASECDSSNDAAKNAEWKKLLAEMAEDARNPMVRADICVRWEDAKRTIGTRQTKEMKCENFNNVLNFVNKYRNPGDPIEWTWEAAEKWANRNPETIKKFINNMNL